MANSHGAYPAIATADMVSTRDGRGVPRRPRTNALTQATTSAPHPSDATSGQAPSMTHGAYIERSLKLAPTSEAAESAATTAKTQMPAPICETAVLLKSFQ